MFGSTYQFSLRRQVLQGFVDLNIRRHHPLASATELTHHGGYGPDSRLQSNAHVFKGNTYLFFVKRRCTQQEWNFRRIFWSTDGELIPLLSLARAYGLPTQVYLPQRYLQQILRPVTRSARTQITRGDWDTSKLLLLPGSRPTPSPNGWRPRGSSPFSQSSAIRLSNISMASCRTFLRPFSSKVDIVC